MSTSSQPKALGYISADSPSWGAMCSLGFQQVLAMFPATVLVAWMNLIFVPFKTPHVANLNEVE